MYVQVKDVIKLSNAYYPKLMGPENKGEDVGRIICDIWSYAKANFDEDLVVYRVIVEDETDPFYFEVVNKKTAKAITKNFNGGSIVSSMPEGERHLVLDEILDVAEFAHKTLSNVPWIDKPLTDEVWVRQALINSHIRGGKVREYSDSARVYELTENGVKKDNIVIIRIMCELFHFDATVVFSENLDDVCLEDLENKEKLIHEHTFAGLNEINQNLLETTLNEMFHTWCPDAEPFTLGGLMDIDGIDSGELYDIVKPMLMIKFVDLINVKLEDRKIKAISYVLIDVCEEDVHITKHKKVGTETNEISGLMPNLIREPRFDQPLLFISGHTRTYISGKTVFVKGYKRHKRMKASWYDV
jgi:hypothetical protein